MVTLQLNSLPTLKTTKSVLVSFFKISFFIYISIWQLSVYIYIKWLYKGSRKDEFQLPSFREHQLWANLCSKGFRGSSHLIPIRILWKWKVKVLVAQSCLTLCPPMECSLPGSSVHGISQARILEWVAIPFSRGSFQPRDQTRLSHVAGRFFNIWATSEAPGSYEYG